MILCVGGGFPYVCFFLSLAAHTFVFTDVYCNS